MDYETRKKQFLGLISKWINKPLAFPPTEGRSDEKSVLVFDWTKTTSDGKEGLLVDSIFGDCEPIDFTDIRNPGEDTLKENWIPFAITNTDLNYAIKLAKLGFNVGWPQFDEVLFVDLNKINGQDTPVYVIEVDGTAIPKKAIPLYEKTIGQLDLRKSKQKMRRV